MASQLSLAWVVRSGVQQSLPLAYPVMAGVQATRSLAWTVRSGVQQALPLAYPVFGTVSANLPLAWTVFSSVGVPELLRISLETAYPFKHQVEPAYQFTEQVEAAYPFKHLVEEAFEYEGEIAAGFPALRVAVKKVTTVCGDC